MVVVQLGSSKEVLGHSVDLSHRVTRVHPTIINLHNLLPLLRSGVATIIRDVDLLSWSWQLHIKLLTHLVWALVDGTLLINFEQILILILG